MSESTRRRVTYSQLEMLWEFLSRNREVAMGYNKTSQARAHSRRMWEEIAHSLNSHGDGAEKDWKGWCKYWNDYKSKIKKLAAAHRSSHNRTGGGPPINKPLTTVEKNFIELLGPDFGSGLPGVRVEPFGEEFSQRQTASCSQESPSVLLGIDTMPNDINQSGPSHLQPQPSPPMPFIPPPPLFATPPPPLPSTSPPPLPSTPPPPQPSTPPPPQPSTPHTSPRRRRRRRSQPALSAMAARRQMVDLVERRVQIEERRNSIFERILEELVEIKQVLQTRQNDFPTAGE